ncbi:hypothetical protein [Mesorhizobium sp. M0296]|uniref:hypothetical protein n=1 Tax=Mesorhizobium sp. M0296 TaxID=2956931 RepID=UPI003338111E
MTALDRMLCAVQNHLQNRGHPHMESLCVAEMLLKQNDRPDRPTIRLRISKGRERHAQKLRPIDKALICRD